MTRVVDWLAARARMMMVFIAVSIGAGMLAYLGLPKEGAPDIDVPVLYVSVPLPGVSATDSERLLVKPLEQELRGLEGLKQMTGIASQDHAGVLLEFEFGWDKAAVLADVRDRVDRAQAEFPDDAEVAVINEVNLSQFPILVISLSGEVPERALLRLGKDLQRAVEAVPAVLEAELAGHRDEMIEVLIDPLKMESYGVTAADLLSIVDRNNRLVAAGQVESGSAEFAVTLPGAFENPAEVGNLPVKVKGDRVVRLFDIGEVRRTFEDAEGRARYNGEPAISLQVSKRVGENIIDTVRTVRGVVESEIAAWPPALQSAVNVDFSMDESARVLDMVGQLESSVMTAVLLVMMVVLATLGFRSAVLVGIAIPCSFLLTFALMAVLGMTVNNMTMFGLILAVGMLVDGAIVVVEYADKRISEGVGPMTAYTEAARRMFWPITASTATTLCAFLPMLFWPGMPGEFMGQLPVTLIFVLSASLIVALLYLPVMGGVAGRISRLLGRIVPQRKAAPAPGVQPYRRTPFGRFIAAIVLRPLGPWLALGVAGAALAGVFTWYGAANNGTEFFVKTDPERAIVYVRARGNLGVDVRDRLVRSVEERVAGVPGVASVFSFSGTGGLAAKSGAEGPPDAIGQVQLELAPWAERGSGDPIIEEIKRRVASVPGVIAELSEQQDGPQQGKPIQLELRSNNWAELHAAADIARAKFETMPGLINIDDTRPLPGIEWQVTVDRATAGRFGADVANVGPIVQLVTRGATLDTFRPDDSDDELDIRVRFPAQDRSLGTLDTLKMPTALGLVPVSNFVERNAVPKLGEIQRRDGERFFMVRAGVDADTSEIARIEELERWIAEENPFPPAVATRFTGDREEQQESMAFLGMAFAGALGLMFVILLAQFNSLYNAVLVLSAVVMSVAGVLVGMIVMGQTFSIIMTGTGIVALAGIVVNNNIILIDTFQEFSRRMPQLEAIVRTAEARIRPVLLTTVTTMAGLAPMMFAASLDFSEGRIMQGAPTALWWVQLATAVVFGLGIATFLTLIVTPAALAARVWVTHGVGVGLRLGWHLALAAIWPAHRAHPYLADWRLRTALARKAETEIIWDEPPRVSRRIVRAAE
ncbi:efflux RND transporter permease subunit [Limibaculum sp. M0105]|uniref:Efflux RND transporter permease subunit n=1 Tax=Thermohalobaculum xanthum TaxID=2753746 RepID=A0A8J7M463_9RHOB|nr:efflux RND transporter permease subunit [Thermohalobaculum xanthum]MBK0397815.1 efflux RND transporter permease subunit [Thermohalobaculum xanthum]